MFPTAGCARKRKLWEAPSGLRTVTVSPASSFPANFSLKLPLWVTDQTQELCHQASKERPAGRTEGNLSIPRWNNRDRSDPAPEAPGSKRTVQSHSHFQGLQFTARRTPPCPELRMGHTGSGFFTLVPALKENSQPLPHHAQYFY